jgi:hypothetical protein
VWLKNTIVFKVIIFLLINGNNLLRFLNFLALFNRGDILRYQTYFLFFVLFSLNFHVSARNPMIVSPYLESAPSFVCKLISTKKGGEVIKKANGDNSVFCTANLVKNEPQDINAQGKYSMVTTGHCLDNFSKENLPILQCGEHSINLNKQNLNWGDIIKIASRNDTMMKIPLKNLTFTNEFKAPRVLSFNQLRKIDYKNCFISGCSYATSALEVGDHIIPNNEIKTDPNLSLTVIDKKKIKQECKIVKLQNLKKEIFRGNEPLAKWSFDQSVSSSVSTNEVAILRPKGFEGWYLTVDADSGGGLFCKKDNELFLVGVHSGSYKTLSILNIPVQCDKISHDFNLVNSFLSKNKVLSLDNSTFKYNLGSYIEINIEFCSEIDQLINKYFKIFYRRVKRGNLSLSVFDTSDLLRIRSCLISNNEIKLHQSGNSYRDMCSCGFKTLVASTSKMLFSCQKKDHNDHDPSNNGLKLEGSQRF